ncbi:FAD-binding oxidoreductase [Thermopetrobacter sp. TC1]|uniref:NAD(P)/FAD-dependent oxidoreductase n=1 Tax=Thermopetrobacter sp. TC1 TaxID=1495045 RepID=UPI00056FA1AD|nr:FAD-binding oxidoreductase [Thermopetrobacter sp. TC1]
MPSSQKQPDPRPLPQRADVVIVGGGIVGAASAFFLARRGLSVLLLEKGEIGGEQSGRNWGWVRRMGRDPREIPLARRALHLWPRLKEEYGIDTGFVPCGILYLCRTPRDLRARLRWFERHAGEAGSDIRLLTEKKTAALLPGLSRPVAGAVYAPRDGRAEPERATRAFAKAAEKTGARIREKCAVLALSRTTGRIDGVITEHGEVRAESVVLAAGVWSRILLERLNTTLPQLGVINSVATLSVAGDVPQTSLGAGAYAFRRRHDGTFIFAHGRISETVFTVQHIRFFRHFLPALKDEFANLRPRLASPFQPWAHSTYPGDISPEPFTHFRVLNPAPSLRILNKALKEAKADFPAFANARMLKAHAGVIDVLPDAVPVIDAPDATPGLVIATGFSGHGFGLGPATGELVAALVTNDEPRVDPTPFRLARLGSGGRI